VRGINIFLVYLKRLIKSPSFMLAAIVIPLLIPLINTFEGNKNDGIVAGVYCESEDNAGFIDALTAREGIVTFEKYDSVDELTLAVENTDINCGYILPEDIFTSVTKNDKKSIICLKSPSTVLSEVASQAILSEFAKVYSKNIAMVYMQNKGISYDEDKLAEYYEEYIDNGEAIAIDYHYEALDSYTEVQNTDTKNENSKDDMVSKSLTGLIAVYMMLGAVLGVNMWLKDEVNGVPFGIMNVVAGVTILGIFSVAAICFKLGFDATLMLKLLLYALLLIGYSAVIKLIFGKQSLICGILPILVLGSLVFCPIFVDLCGFVPNLRWVGRIFAPHYFMADIPELVIAALCFALVPFGICKIKELR
jgi:ABC-2 type transport system permease protein